MPACKGARSPPARSTHAGLTVPSTDIVAAPAGAAISAASRMRPGPRFTWLLPPQVPPPATDIYGGIRVPDAVYNSSFLQSGHGEQIQSARRRAPGPGLLGAHQRLSRAGSALPAQVLLPVDVPVPVRQAPHGSRAQLYDRRRS